VDGAFVDGGVSPFNNPALQLLLMATLRGYNLNWPMGPEKLLLVSVGTGDGEDTLAPDKVMKMTAIEQAMRSLAALMTDCDALVRTILQWLGQTPNGTPIDREVGNLSDDTIGGQKWLSYIRYNATLEGTWLRDHLKLDIEDVDAVNLREMDDPSNVDMLARVGTMAAEVQLKPDHFPACFDLPLAAN
jgi:hypothetical protein